MNVINIQYCKTKIGELILGSFEGKLCLLDFRYRKMRKSVDDSVIDKWESTPMSPARMMSELANALPKNTMVVDDSISHRSAMRHYFHGKNRGDIVAVRGLSLIHI